MIGCVQYMGSKNACGESVYIGVFAFRENIPSFCWKAKRPCTERINAASYEFNQKWKPTLANLQASLPGSTIFYSNRYDVAVQTLQNPMDYGKVCRFE